jgi:hypothetical protein
MTVLDVVSIVLFTILALTILTAVIIVLFDI